MKYVAVEGMTVVYTAELSGVPAGSAIVEATLGAASTNVSEDGRGVYVDGLQHSASTWEIGPYVGAGLVVANFESSASFVEVDGTPVLLEGDKVLFDVSATNPATSDTQTFTITGTIVSAGQNTLTAD